MQQLAADGGAIRGRFDALVEAHTPAADIRWLDLCVAAAELHAALGQLASLLAAVEELAAAYPEEYPAERLRGQIETLRLQFVGAIRLDPAEEQTRRLLGELADLKREALIVKNPLLNGKQLLFVKRFTYDSDHYYDEFINGAKTFGGGLFTLQLDDGSVREIAPALSGGVVDRYDLSFDGRRIVFGYKPPRPEGYRIYEVRVDGTDLRQITRPPLDEDRRMSLYCKWSSAELQAVPWRYGHWTDDMHPCYLPDGGIAFTSTRGEQTALRRARPDGDEPASRGGRWHGPAAVIARGTLRSSARRYSVTGVSCTTAGSTWTRVRLRCSRCGPCIPTAAGRRKFMEITSAHLQCSTSAAGTRS